jgi:hypothetical protein
MALRRWQLVGFALLVACSAPVPQMEEFDIDAPARLRPLLTPDEAARVALDHIAAQPVLPVGGDHPLEADIGDVTLIQAPDAPLFEADLPPAMAESAGPSFLVWIVTFRRGNLLNQAVLPWSMPGPPGHCGSIVIADAGATVLGVYPAAVCPT